MDDICVIKRLFNWKLSFLQRIDRMFDRCYLPYVGCSWQSSALDWRDEVMVTVISFFFLRVFVTSIALIQIFIFLTEDVRIMLLLRSLLFRRFLPYIYRVSDWCLNLGYLGVDGMFVRVVLSLGIMTVLVFLIEFEILINNFLTLFN